MPFSPGPVRPDEASISDAAPCVTKVICRDRPGQVSFAANFSTEPAHATR
jgi:hypothetical protein